MNLNIDSLSLNNPKACKPGLLNDLLLESYKGILGTTEEDKINFHNFDQDVVNHPQWLGRYVFITTLENKPIGFVSFDPREKPLAKIGHNCVLPEHRRKGIGKRQIEYVLDQMKSQGFEEVIVSTCDNKDFIPAQKMYLACGFKETRRFYKNGKEGDPNQKMIEYKIVFDRLAI